MALRVISHTPNINATGVYLNESIDITFDKRINTNTIDYTTLSVNDHSNFTSVPGSYSVGYNSSGEAVTAIFTPLLNLTPNTLYDVYVFGNPDSILAEDGDYIPTTYMYSFTTGIETYDEDSGSGSLPSGYSPSEWSGVLSEIPPSATGSIDSFYVYTTTPKHQTPNTCIGLSGIDIVFTGTVQTSLTNLSGYITLEETPVLQ